MCPFSFGLRKAINTTIKPKTSIGQNVKCSLSHDNIFHTLLSALDVKTRSKLNAPPFTESTNLLSGEIITDRLDL